MHYSKTGEATVKYILAVAALMLIITPLQAQKKITYLEHIEPILLKNCAPCHRPGTAAPFSLLSYDDAAKRGKMIQFVTGKRYMPPWKADPTYRSFANEKILKDEEIALISDWVRGGMEKGKESKKSKAKTASVPSQRAPDTVLSAVPFTIKGNNKENFTLLVIPFEFDRELNVESIEYTSSAMKIIHHANFGIYAVDSSIDINMIKEPIDANAVGSKANQLSILSQNIVYYNGWVPGATPITFSKGIGFRMPRRGVIVLTNHYAPSPIDMTETSSLKFYFSKDEIHRSVQTLSIGSGGVGEVRPSLMLMPEEINSFKIQMEIVEPLSLMYVWPHMHLLGKSFKAYYALNGDTIPLVRINDWDFNWQEAYKFKKIQKLPAGAILTVEGVYDNTSKNPRNPNNPPQIVFSDGLMGTKNEMLSLIIVYLPYKEGDENTGL
jgi:mono/diheme cytochrome c family protein